ncbi:Ppx/GppA phosphatase family protein [Comamonas composti]|uniref:Ppx/GppA phosphatase family protein n=1 Tax=Comamonas composti TaxID=408558 RepID=UPI00042A6686|nr:Ppx/GppA phosphatase family protein [Comamonas composti]
MVPHSLLAAVDLGSNSFRLEIGRVGSHQRIERVEYLKETVRQGNGLNEQQELTRPAMERGWECLARFGERLAGFAPEQVRAVATQTLREALNREQFIRRGSELLGFPIEVIAGEEEARLIYRGVASLLPPSQERRLVVDIGGRSTEIIIGEQASTRQVASYPIGSVAWSNQFFADGQLSSQRFSAAIKAAEQALAQAVSAYPQNTWDRAYASSGTANAVGDLLSANGQDGKTVTPAGLGWLHEQLLQAGHVDRIKLPGLKEDRRPVIAGGLSVLIAATRLLGIGELEIAQGALRQGVLHDLQAHEPPADREAAEISALQHDFGIDTTHARRVRKTATWAWLAMARESEPGDAWSLHALETAACLHEIGMRISLSAYHRHGAYITAHCSAATWPLQLRTRISQLVLGHQGKLRKLEGALEDPAVAWPLLALRLAVQLCHAHRDPDLQHMSLQRQGNTCVLKAPADWARNYPQSAQLLRTEAAAWHKTPWTLELKLNTL